MNGKGDKRRPPLVPRKQIDKNWDKIFKKQGGGNELPQRKRRRSRES